MDLSEAVIHAHVLAFCYMLRQFRHQSLRGISQDALANCVGLRVSGNLPSQEGVLLEVLCELQQASGDVPAKQLLHAPFCRIAGSCWDTLPGECQKVLQNSESLHCIEGSLHV